MTMNYTTYTYAGSISVVRLADVAEATGVMLQTAIHQARRKQALRWVHLTELGVKANSGELSAVIASGMAKAIHEACVEWRQRHERQRILQARVWLRRYEGDDRAGFTRGQAPSREALERLEEDERVGPKA